MALWVCAGCTCRYAVGAPACPSCASVDCYEEGDDSMAKITRHGGPTTAFVRPGEGDFFQGAPDPITPEPDAGADTEGGAPSPGNSSSPSPDETPTKSERSETPRPSPARTTGNPSKRGRGGN